VVTPVNKGTQSVVRHMLAMDWKLWRLYSRPSSSRSITISMLERVAGIYLSILRKIYFLMTRYRISHVYFLVQVTV
jgi:hypothetical protein